MKPNVKNAVVTVVLLSVLAGGLFLSMRDRTQEVVQEAQQVEQSKRAAAVFELSGLIALDIEPFFKDARVLKVLEDSNFRVNVTRIGSRDMASRIAKDNAPDFFISSGVVAGNQITDAAKKFGFTTATYSPYVTPMVLASWAPIAKILTSNKVASNAGSEKIYDVDMLKLTEVMLAKKRWRDLPGSGAYDVGRSVLVSTTDVRKSNSAAMYLALTSYAINNSEVITTRENAQKVALQVADLFKRQGYQESYVNGNFDDYVGIGIGKTPLAFIYENQLVNYAITRKKIDAEMVLMYPKPTIFNKLVMVTMRDKAKPLAELMSTNTELIKVATEYGFRTGDGAALAQASAGAGLAVKPRVVDVVDPPSYEIMAHMIDVVAEQMKQ